MLLGVTAIWGWTFLIVKDAVASYPVLAFLSLRFMLAVVLLAPFAVRGFSRKDLAAGLLIGIPVAFAYLFQTVGLTSTSAANAGLLTGLFVIFTPLLDAVLYRAAIARVTVAATVTGLAGTGFLTLAGSHGLHFGDFLEVLTAVGFAVQTVWLGHHTTGRSSMQLALGQMIPPAALFLILPGAQGAQFHWPSAAVWIAVFITGALASSLAFWVQTYVQQRIPPARAAIILLGEPAFAAAFAVWLGGERLSPVQWCGASLILLSLLLHELWMAGVLGRRTPV